MIKCKLFKHKKRVKAQMNEVVEIKDKKDHAEMPKKQVCKEDTIINPNPYGGDDGYEKDYSPRYSGGFPSLRNRV